MQLLLVAVLALLVAGSAMAGPLTAGPVTGGAPKAPKTGLLGDDECSFCVNAMGQIISNLLNIILNAGVGGSCGDLCGKLGNQIEQVACMLLCEYVGLTAFVDAIQYEDPDPIFLCEEFGFCHPVAGGKANIMAIRPVPAVISQGQTVAIEIEWNVTSPTGPGGLNVAILPPLGFPISGGSFIDGQKVGVYGAKFELKTQPTELDPMQPGKYIIDVALCEGDCTTNHKWGGIYAQGKSSFTMKGQ